jgi:SAM-dependent methyltransferase
MKSPTERFSDRVENYAKYRPDYPGAMLQYLVKSVPAPARVADIGAGTGILTGQLLEAGYEVFAVEPNGPMAEAAERELGRRSSFHSVPGTAEATTLESGSVDLVTCAQSFHWFDREKARFEFNRILRAGAPVAIIWNERLVDASDFQGEYEAILRRLAPEYPKVVHRQVTRDQIQAFFGSRQVQLFTFPHFQLLDREAFLGRVLSSSFVPNVGQPGHMEVMSAIAGLFDRGQTNGRVRMEYETRLYWGRFAATLQIGIWV